MSQESEQNNPKKTLILLTLVVVLSCIGFIIFPPSKKGPPLAAWARNNRINALFNSLPVNPDHDMIGEDRENVTFEYRRGGYSNYSGYRNAIFGTSQPFEEIRDAFSDQMLRAGWSGRYLESEEDSWAIERAKYYKRCDPGSVVLTHINPFLLEDVDLFWYLDLDPPYLVDLFEDIEFDTERYEVFYEVSVRHHEYLSAICRQE